MVPVDIAMRSTGNLHYIQLAIAELGRRTYVPFRLFVISQGDGSGIPELLAEMVQDHYLDAVVLLTENAKCDCDKLAASLARGEYLIQTTDEWLPPADCPDWPHRLVGALEENLYFGTMALRPSFFPSGMPPMTRGHRGLLTAVWLEESFRIVRLNESRWSWQRLQGYLPDLVAEYLPQAQLNLVSP